MSSMRLALKHSLEGDGSLTPNISSNSSISNVYGSGISSGESRSRGNSLVSNKSVNSSSYGGAGQGSVTGGGASALLTSLISSSSSLDSNSSDDSGDDISSKSSSVKRVGVSIEKILSEEQKAVIINKHYSMPTMSQKSLADWANKELNLSHGLGLTQPNISNILKGNIVAKGSGGGGEGVQTTNPNTSSFNFKATSISALTTEEEEEEGEENIAANNNSNGNIEQRTIIYTDAANVPGIVGNHFAKSMSTSSTLGDDDDNDVDDLKNNNINNISSRSGGNDENNIYSNSIKMKDGMKGEVNSDDDDDNLDEKHIKLATSTSSSSSSSSLTSSKSRGSGFQPSASTKDKLTLEQKILLINKRKISPSMSQTQMAEWARVEFKLPFSLSQAFVSKLLKHAKTLVPDESVMAMTTASAASASDHMSFASMKKEIGTRNSMRAPNGSMNSSSSSDEDSKKYSRDVMDIELNRQEDKVEEEQSDSNNENGDDVKTSNGAIKKAATVDKVNSERPRSSSGLSSSSNSAGSGFGGGVDVLSYNSNNSSSNNSNSSNSNSNRNNNFSSGGSSNSNKSVVGVVSKGTVETNGSGALPRGAPRKNTTSSSSFSSANGTGAATISNSNSNKAGRGNNYNNSNSNNNDNRERSNSSNSNNSSNNINNNSSRSREDSSYSSSNRNAQTNAAANAPPDNIVSKVISVEDEQKYQYYTKKRLFGRLSSNTPTLDPVLAPASRTGVSNGIDGVDICNGSGDSSSDISSNGNSNSNSNSGMLGEKKMRTEADPSVESRLN